MKYAGMPFGMWALFGTSFERNLIAVFELDGDASKVVTSKAKQKYKEIIRKLPEFEKGDRFKMNIVSCAMLSAFVLSMPERPDVEKLTVYYRQAMMTPTMRWFCRMSEVSGASHFVRECTIANGDDYCDCGYKRKS